MMKPVIQLIIIILATGCSGDTTRTGNPIELFDVKEYLEADLAGRIQMDITKTISYNGDAESIDLEQYDLQGDIEILSQANINNPSWTDKYEVASSPIVDGLQEMIYTAVDPKLQTQKLTVFKLEDKVVGFEAHQIRNALIAKASKKISYRSDKGYEISTKSKNMITLEQVVKVEVVFGK